MTTGKGAVRDSRTDAPAEILPYISPRELADRWRCSLSSAYRIAEEEGFTKVRLGKAKTGKNSMVRYLRKEVEAFEKSRQFPS